MVYVDPAATGYEPLIVSWMDRLPTVFTPETRAVLQALFDDYVAATLQFKARLEEPVPVSANSVVSSLCSLLNCFFERMYEKEGRESPKPVRRSAWLRAGSCPAA